MKNCPNCKKNMKIKEKYCTGCGMSYSEAIKFLLKKNSDSPIKANIYKNDNESKHLIISTITFFSIFICCVTSILPIIINMPHEENNDFEYIEEETYSFDEYISLGNFEILIYKPFTSVDDDKKVLSFYLYINNFTNDEDIIFDLKDLVINTNKQTYGFTGDDINNYIINVNKNDGVTENFKAYLNMDEELVDISFTYNEKKYIIKKD